MRWIVAFDGTRIHEACGVAGAMGFAFSLTPAAEDFPGQLLSWAGAVAFGVWGSTLLGSYMIEKKWGTDEDGVV